MCGVHSAHGLAFLDRQSETASKTWILPRASDFPDTVRTVF